jgi:hypothetical protein
LSGQEKKAMRTVVIIFMLLVTGLSCHKEETRDEFTGTIEDFTGRLDGCGYLIQLDNGNRLEPAANYSGQPLTPGRRIAIRYKSKPAFSICMAGETVEIISLRYL